MNIRAYPIFLHLAHHPVLVVGGGAVALRKVRGLMECNAVVQVISPQLTPDLAALKNIETILAPYQRQHLAAKPWRLIFAATDSPETNAAIQQDAAAANILCCRCDDQSEGDFANGAVACIKGITLAVSTHGASPALAKKIRDQAVAAIDPILAQLAGLAENWREQTKRELPVADARHQLLRKVAGDEMEACLRAGGPAAAEALFRRWLAESQTPAAVARG